MCTGKKTRADWDGRKSLIHMKKNVDTLEMKMPREVGWTVH